MKETHIGPDYVYVITQNNYRLGLYYASIYDTTSGHLACRANFLSIAKRIKFDKVSVFIECKKDGSTKNITDIDDFVNWIVEVFEEGDPELHGFSTYVKSEITK